MPQSFTAGLGCQGRRCHCHNQKTSRARRTPRPPRVRTAPCDRDAAAGPADPASRGPAALRGGRCLCHRELQSRADPAPPSGQDAACDRDAAAGPTPRASRGPAAVRGALPSRWHRVSLPRARGCGSPGGPRAGRSASAVGGDAGVGTARWEFPPDDYRAWDIQKTELYKREQTYSPPAVKFGNSTTFQDDYVPQEIKPRQSFRPSSVVKCSTCPFDGDTSHRLDYVPYQLEVKSARPREVYKPTSQPFEVLTTHRRDFQGLAGETAKICRPAHTRVTQRAHFEGSTEFRESFQLWELPPPEVRKVQEYVPPAGAMQSDSTSHLDYVPHQATRVLPVRPLSHRRRNSDPFQGKSTTKEDFPAWESHRQGPVKQQPQIPAPSGRFEGLSTFRSHYVPHELVPTESCRPLHVPVKSSALFDDVTMYSTEYVPKRREICPASCPSPPGYVFEHTDSRGHQFFRKVTPVVKAF
ncbi:stabilizer of axonemal microtubules 2 [Equus asinus]|uniref:stabilizer of axonemal microtubules 2 n=1 Tax=Equus asinus TaxID=9793 RepID=UPI0038F7ADAC